jgi:hypothetical protein
MAASRPAVLPTHLETCDTCPAQVPSHAMLLVMARRPSDRAEIVPILAQCPACATGVQFGGFADSDYETATRATLERFIGSPEAARRGIRWLSL